MAWLRTSYYKEPMIFIFLEYSIDCAHWLPNVPSGHKCGVMHGHRYDIRLEVSGSLNDHTGWIVDYADVKQVYDPIIMGLDHRTLNNVPGLENPTCERIVDYLRQRLPPFAGCFVASIEVRETDRAGAGWRA